MSRSTFGQYIYEYHSISATIRQLLARGGRVLEGMAVKYFEASERARQRRELASLDDHLLADIGLTRSDAEQEWNKHFWE